MRVDIRTVSSGVLLVLAVATSILLAAGATCAQGGQKTAKPANTPFAGEWDTTAAGARFTVRLKQVGRKVTGTYAPYNGKIFEGVVTGNKLTFKWTQDGGYEGIGEFTLDADRKGFTGSSTVIKPEPRTHSWNTYKPAPPQSFAGTWDLVNNANVRIPLTIVQKGAKATGIYPSQNGTLEGTIDGRILRFTWESDKGSGSGQFQISNSGETFSVTFKKGDGTEFNGSGSWGERTSGGKVGNGNANGSDGVIIGGSGGKIMASFDGAWTVTEGGAIGIMALKQSGALVTGAYVNAQGSFELKGGRVNGNTLRFALGARTATSAARTAELVMDPNGKSFKGQISGVPTTGTRKDP